MVEIRPTMGMQFVHYTGDGGVVRSIWRTWTSVACEDPFVRVSETLILDEDGVYDPGNFNDRFLLGSRAR